MSGRNSYVRGSPVTLVTTGDFIVTKYHFLRVLEIV